MLQLKSVELPRFLEVAYVPVGLCLGPKIVNNGLELNILKKIMFTLQLYEVNSRFINPIWCPVSGGYKAKLSPACMLTVILSVFICKGWPKKNV